ncbi:MAG TPA: peptidylprolyl isomerase [Fibrobacteria bacterium]|nr:peptidylprolyl isomerase [Fibrobacteria bacterium]
MTLEWMKKQAKWVIGIFGIFILGGLIMMDRAGSYRSDRHHDIVGSVDGEEIPTKRFQAELSNYLKGQEAQTGKAPEGAQLAQIREGMFNFKVQTVLMQKIFDEYQLRASREEMMDYVVKHPQEVAGHIARYRGYEEMPPFLADSTIDQARYQDWLAQDSIYDRYSMRELEEQLRLSVIPQIQLQQIMKSQIHRTPLEEAYNAATRETKAKVKYYQVSADSFPVNPEKFQDADLKAYYDAHPDSFYFHDDAARLAYVKLPLKPSHADSALMADFAKELKERVRNGEKFADLAKDYSNDPGSAEKGGKLEGLRGREGLDPAFANAAFALNPGEISDPVLSQFGYHIIQLNDKKKVDSTEKIEVSHILLKVTAGTETVDSLMGEAEKIRASAQKGGLEKAARDAKLALEKSPIFEKNNYSPLGTYVQGASSFAFGQFEAKEKISEALQAEDGIYLFERDARFEKGRNFDRAKGQIGNLLARDEKLKLAKRELEAQKAAIASAPEGALPARFGKAVLDSTAAGAISADNWLPGFGYSSPALFKVFNQPVGAWGQVEGTEMGAVMAKVVEKVPLSEADLAAKVQTQLQQNDQYLVSGIYQEWVAALPKSAKVVNHMDLSFRN